MYCLYRYSTYICTRNKAKQKPHIMTTISKLREIQNEEVANGFVNGNLWNDLEDLIYKIENPEAETIQGDMYGAKEPCLSFAVLSLK